MKRFVLVVWMMLGCAWVGSAAAQDCLVKQAADAAVQRQIAMLDAAKVNPSEFFSGANSCIAPILLQKIDLSNVIPSLQNFMTSGAQSMINNLISQAQAQVCQILNSQLQNLVGRINGAGNSFQSQLGSQLTGLLGGSNAFSPVSLPSVGGIGSYNLVSQVGQPLFGTTQQPVVQPVGPSGSTPIIVQPVAPPSTTNFGTILQ